MNLGTNKQQGSMGIPPHLTEAAEKQRILKAKKDETKPEPKTEPPVIQPQEGAEGSSEKEQEGENPTELLKAIGAKFTDEDFHKLLFRGYYETELDIIKDRFKATLKTLTTKEYDEVDELLAEEIKTIPMTSDGYNNRYAMWIISFGVTQLMGKPVAKVVMKDNVIDAKETAKKRREAFGMLAPQLTNLLIQKHGVLTVALNIIARKPEVHLKNS